jgi:hypothetical protein
VLIREQPQHPARNGVNSFYLATTRWSVRRLTILGLVGLLLTVMPASQANAVGATRTGTADPPPYLADAADPAVTTLASDLGISIREAQRRMGWQEPAMELAGELERALGDRYGDLWFDEADGGRVKVGLVGDGAALAARPIARRKLTAAQQATLAEAKRRLGDLLTLGTWAGQMRDLACAWRTTTFDCDPPLRGGVTLYVRSGASYVPQCTAGFNARSTVDGKWYVMTAGHCGAPGRTFYVYQHRTNTWHVLGHMHNRVWGGASGDDDFGIITIDNVPGWNPQPWVYVHPSADTVYNATYTISGTEGSKQGMRVCVSGAISGSDCGSVETLGMGGLARVDLCAGPGDSGAPIFSAGKARGLLKGANAPDPGQPPTPPCEDRLYQGLTEASQQLRVSVVHT